MKTEHLRELPEAVQEKIYTEAQRRAMMVISGMTEQFEAKKETREKIILLLKNNTTPESKAFIEENIEKPEFWSAIYELIVVMMMPFVSALKMTSITIDLPAKTTTGNKCQ